MRLPDPARSMVAALLALFTATASGELALAADILPCAQFTHEGPPQPIARGDRRGLERLDRINQAVNSTPYSVLFLGDSLTEGWDPVVWERSLVSRGVLNAGISGDFTDHILWRLEHGNLAGRGDRRRGGADMDHCRERSYPETSHMTQPGIMFLTDLPREGDFRA